MGSDENNEIHSIHITRMRDGRKAQVKRKQHPTKHTLVSSLSPVPFWFADTRTRTRAQADVWLCAKGFRVVATKNTFLYIMSDLRFLVAHVEHSRTRHHQNTIKANPHRDDVRIRSGISVLHWACLFVCVCVRLLKASKYTRGRWLFAARGLISYSCVLMCVRVANLLLFMISDWCLCAELTY